MAVTNTLVKGTATANTTGEETFQVHGENVTLSPEIIKRYLVSGDPSKVTDQEVMMFLQLCKYQKLNPFLREAYLIKYGNSPATIVTGKDVFIRRAAKNPDFDGYQAGVIVLNKQNGSIDEREGSLWIGSIETLVGGWAKVYVKGLRTPYYAAVSYGEYVGRKADGSVNQQWATKPATMIRKVALSQALREAFPENSGMYSPEEISDGTIEVLDEKPIQVEQKPSRQIEQAAAKTTVKTQAPIMEAVPAEAISEEDAAMAALFG